MFALPAGLLTGLAPLVGTGLLTGLPIAFTAGLAALAAGLIPTWWPLFPPFWTRLLLIGKKLLAGAKWFIGIELLIGLLIRLFIGLLFGTAIELLTGTIGPAFGTRPPPGCRLLLWL